jgi:alkylated DNA repair dioxygenase AlkB
MTIERYDLSEDSSLILVSNFLGDSDALEFMNHYQKSLHWKQDTYKFGTTTVKSPRLIALVGDNIIYKYSCNTHNGQKSDERMVCLLSRLYGLKVSIPELKTDYNGILFNLYRDERDSLNFHTDNEPCMDLSSPICTISLGASRRFLIKPQNPSISLLKKHTQFWLPNGSLAIMAGKFQEEFLHSIPKELEETRQRMSLTFRKFY